MFVLSLIQRITARKMKKKNEQRYRSLIYSLLYIDFFILLMSSSNFRFFEFFIQIFFFQKNLKLKNEIFLHDYFFFFFFVGFLFFFQCLVCVSVRERHFFVGVVEIMNFFMRKNNRQWQQLLLFYIQNHNTNNYYNLKLLLQKCFILFYVIFFL